MPENLRAIYNSDVVRIGDAVLQVTDAYRINYETWGNGDQALHTHITPRYLYEPDEKRTWPVCMAYGWKDARPFDLATDRAFMEAMKKTLASLSNRGSAR